MSHNFWILLTILSIASICKALPNVHKLMTQQQLQTVFHVESAADVPHYEIVQLLHHSNDAAAATADFSHYRNRRSINSVAASPSSSLGLSKETHHVKKDLSKNPYYSELKAAANNQGSALLNSVYASPPLTNKQNDVHSSDLSKLESHNVTFEAFGKQHNLKLLKTEGLFKGAPHMMRMWTVSEQKNATNGLDLQEVLDGHQNSEDVGHVFQDEENMAAILMRRHEETGDLIMEGSIGHEMVIKPLPHDLSPSKQQAHHVIYKREAAKMEHLSDFAFMEPDDLASSEKLEKLQQQRRQRRSANLDDLTVDEAAELTEDELDNEDEISTAESRNRARRQVPYMIYPEILVIVDYDGYRLHGGDNLQVKRYFISFWNGVDLRYRLLKGPRIRISIAGIIISRGRDATPYLERNRVGRDAIDSAAALTDMGKYLFRERRLPVYDIAVAITKYDMCRRRKGGRCTKGTAGFAYVGGACVVNKRLEKVNSVAIIEDTGGFSGIIVAAHEVGHLLGAVHDGSPPPSYLGGPGAQRCRWEDGYIMSDLRHTERGFRWSPCTVQSFHHFLNGDTATCLHNQPHEDSALGRSLPGTLLSLDAQCRRDRGTYACFKDERVCAQLFCFDAQTGYCVAYRPAAEGSSCGNGLHCLDGRCAPSPTNNVGYGPQYRLYNATNTNGQHHQNNNKNNAANNADDDNLENDDDNNSNNDDNVESNEAIDKQKRKFDVKFTARLQEQQQLLRQQQPQLQQEGPTTIANVIPTARNVIFGGRTPTTTARSNSFLEAYFRKLQAFNAPPPQQSAPLQQHQQQQQITATTIPTTNAQSPTKLLAQVSPSPPPSPKAIKLLTTTTSSSSTSSSISSMSTSTSTATTLNKKHLLQQQQQREQQQKQFDKFAGHFLKRTPNSTIINRNSSYSSLNNNNNHHHNNHNQRSSHHQQNHNQQQEQEQEKHDNEHEVEITTKQKTTQPPAYVTNYIGDPTNHLPAIVVNDNDDDDKGPRDHVKTELDSLNLSTTLTTTKTNINTATTTTKRQQQQQAQVQHKTQQQKIKSQKLIRRQLLRTQQIK